MKNIIKTLQGMKYKKHYHHVCGAGSIVRRVDVWGDKKIYECPHKGKNDWGLLYHDVSPCRDCSGKLKGFLDLKDFEKHENEGIDRAIRVLEKKRKGA